jgi:hypothetical protein
MLKIGVVYEGVGDTEIVKVLLTKILKEQEFSIVKDIANHTGIIGFTRVYARQLFEVDQVDVAVFLTDQDVPPDRDDRHKRIKEEIEKVNVGYLEFSAIGVPNPHLEHWLLQDESVLKRIFSLNHEARVPHADLLAKSQLKALWSEMPTPKLSMRETLLRIVNEMSLDLMLECPDFRLFHGELINATRRAASSNS